MMINASYFNEEKLEQAIIELLGNTTIRGQALLPPLCR